MSKIKDIPKGWTIASLVNDLPYIKTGVPEYKGKKKYFSTGSIKLDSIIEEGEYSFSEKPSRANRLAIKGDVLQARMKATDKAILIGAKLDGQLFSTGFFQIRPIDGKLSSSYILHYLTSLKFTQIKDELCSGSTQSALNDEGAKKIFISIPPFKEQQAIVSKIEELLSELENGKQQLQTACQQLKVYRQSLLKWAFEGKLTKHKGEWRKIKLGEVASAVDPQPSHRTPPIFPNGIPYASIKDFDSELDKIDLINARKVSPDVLREHLNRYKLQGGDFVIGKIGTIGKPVRVILPQNYSLSANIVLIQPRKVNPTYLYYFFQSNQIEKAFKAGMNATTQAAFGIQKVRELQIDLPNEKEQQLIVEELESKLTVCDKIEETINQSLQQAETLRQSILKKAFEGKLVKNKK